MAKPFPIPSEEVYPNDDVRWWLNSLDPSIDLTVVELNRLRKIEKDIRLQMAWIIGYVMTKMGLDLELEPMPDILKSPYDWQDEDDNGPRKLI